MALTEYRTISAPLLTWVSIAFRDASTGPLPSDAPLTSQAVHGEYDACGRALTGFAVLGQREESRIAL